jgi:hypothetical protein
MEAARARLTGEGIQIWAGKYTKCSITPISLVDCLQRCVEETGVLRRPLLFLADGGNMWKTYRE